MDLVYIWMNYREMGFDRLEDALEESWKEQEREYYEEEDALMYERMEMELCGIRYREWR